MKYTKYLAILIIVFTGCNVSNSPTDPYPFSIEAFTVDSPTTATYTDSPFTLNLSYDIDVHRVRIPAERIAFTLVFDSEDKALKATADWQDAGMWPSNIHAEHAKSHKGVVTITGHIDRPCYLLLDKTIAINYVSDWQIGGKEIILNTKGIAEAVSYIGQCN